jgi:hypothetical protein
MAAAEKANRRNAAMFVFHEDVHYTERRPDGTFRRNTRASYEVSILEGEPYHRRTSLDGQPLSAVDAALEDKRFREVERFRRETPVEQRRKRYFAAEENRFKIDSGIVLQYHAASLIREESFQGRACWVVETSPRAGSPKPKRRSQWSLSQRLHYWIDKETLFPIRVLATQLFDFDTSRKGTLTEIISFQEEGTWLLKKIVSEGTRKMEGEPVAYRTTQDYRDYQHFTASSSLSFEPDQD